MCSGIAWVGPYCLRYSLFWILRVGFRLSDALKQVLAEPVEGGSAEGLGEDVTNLPVSGNVMQYHDFLSDCLTEESNPCGDMLEALRGCVAVGKEDSSLVVAEEDSGGFSLHT